MPVSLVHSHHDDSDDDNDEFDEDGGGRSYLNRSLFWTNKYRKLFPYEQARKSVLEMGFRSREEWDEYVADGKEFHGAYLPSHPDEMYAGDWVSWEEWLGLMRPYEEARHMVQHVLKLTNLDEYMRFVEADPRRAEGLRIPYKPHIVYRDKGWDVDDFFGSMQ